MLFLFNCYHWPPTLMVPFRCLSLLQVGEPIGSCVDTLSRSKDDLLDLHLVKQRISFDSITQWHNAVKHESDQR